MNHNDLLEKLNLEWLISLWHSGMEVSLWQMLLIGCFFLAVNLGICAAMWLMRRGILYEVVFPNRNRKYIKKKTASYSLVEEILLFRLASESGKYTFMIFMCLFFNIINIVSFLGCCVGFLGAILTLADGWALSLLVFPPFSAMILSAVFEFVPGIVLVPSVGRKYGLRK